jgi:epimerase transport system membrane fusion protein
VLMFGEKYKDLAPDDDSSIRAYGYAAILLIFGLGGLWLVFAPLESAALAIGTVSVEGKRKQVQHFEGGVIAEILVKNGDLVESGEKLLILDAARDRAELQILRGRSDNTLALVNRLQAERDDQTEIIFSEELLTNAATDARASEAITNETALFDVRLVNRNGERALLQQKVSQLNEQLAGQKLLKDNKIEIADSLEEEISDLKALLIDGYVDKQRIRELERSRTQSLGELADLQANIATLDIAIKEAELEILQLVKRFKNDVVAQLLQAQADLFDIRQQITAVADRVERATLTSPTAGVVMAFSKNTLGSVIRPGETVLEIVPEGETLVVDAKISPMDIDRIRIGQEVEVRFGVFKDAYNISGTLTRVSADILIDENTQTGFYTAEVRLVQADLKYLGGQVIVPGMPAEVLIKTGDRTMLGYLLSPLNRMFSRSFTED